MDANETLPTLCVSLYIQAMRVPNCQIDNTEIGRILGEPNLIAGIFWDGWWSKPITSYDDKIILILNFESARERKGKRERER